MTLGKVFKNLANSATFYQRPDLLSAYFKGNALSQYGRLASVLGVSGVGFMIAAVTLTLVAYFVPPLFARFIMLDPASVLGAIGLVAGGAALITWLKTRATVSEVSLATDGNAEIKKVNTPSIIRDKSNLANWLVAHGYGTLTEVRLIELLKSSPALCDAIDVSRDFSVFQPFLENEKKWLEIYRTVSFYFSGVSFCFSR